MTIPDLAQQAIQHLRPELLILAAKGAESAATESGKQLISWFRDRLKSPAAKATLDDAVATPKDDDRIAALELQIKILLKDHVAFEELSALLKHLPVNTLAHQTATATGGSKVAQVAGPGNKVNIS